LTIPDSSAPGDRPFLEVRGKWPVGKKRFRVVARVSTESPDDVRPVLQRLIVHGTVKSGSAPDEFLIQAEFDGESAKELNRTLLSVLRRVEKRTRLRAEWTSGDVTERFFDYVSKGSRKGN
jgi:hypothetical protein